MGAPTATGPDKLPVTGSAGAPPPPGAPHEVSQPLAPETIQAQLALAHQNEQELQPLKFAVKPPVPVAQPPAAVGGVSLKPSAAVADPYGFHTTIQSLVDQLADLETPGSPTSEEGPVLLPPTSEEEAGLSTQSPPPLPHHPAGSDTDTPSKGIPKPIHDLGKQITGGWGEPTGGQYFALDGNELRVLIESLMADLKKQMTVDLRFSIALTYPQVRARVLIQIDGADQAAGINDVKFDLIAAKVFEADAVALDDQSTPADALRGAAGLKKPHKHLVKSGIGHQFADVEN